MENQGSNQEQTKHQFDSFCKVIARNTARNCYKTKERRGKKETTITDLSEKEMRQLKTMDNYFNNEFSFDVHGIEVVVQGETLSEAITCLSTKRRNIILLYYFIGLNDRQISELLNLLQRTVNNNRLTSLKKLNDLLKGGQTFGKEQK